MIIININGFEKASIMEAVTKELPKEKKEKKMQIKCFAIAPLSNILQSEVKSDEISIRNMSCCQMFHHCFVRKFILQC